jgi:hypothetical protein
MKTKLAIAVVLVILTATSLGIMQSAIAKGTPYQAGYRAGVIAADKDVQNIDKPGSPGVDANNIKCPPDSSPDYCSGYKKGYTDEAVSSLD